MANLLHILKYPTGNRLGQFFLRKQVKLCQWLMGIGAGGEVDCSGEGKIMKRLAASGSNDLVVIDAGANQGQFLRMAVSQMGNHLASIHSFEPAAETFRTLSDNAPEHPGVVLNHVALGAEVGKAELFYDQENSGLASMTRRDLAFRGIPFEKSETIQVTTLDRYAKEKEIDRIDWLKIDVEGHELDVLKGAEGLLRLGAIPRVTFEFGGCNVDTRTFFRDFYQFFDAYNMRIYRITPNGFLSPIKRYRETEEQFNTINYLAVLED